MPRRGDHVSGLVRGLHQPSYGIRHWPIGTDIQATKPEGFDESEVRTIGENARVLKFDPSSGFEKS